MMRKNKSFLLPLMILLFVNGILLAQDDKNNNAKFVVRADPSNAYGAKLSDVMEEVTYIPLETNEVSLFGRITQLEVTDKYFVLLDKDTNCILVFRRDGKFHSKIKGSFANDKIHRFTINRWKEEILLLEGWNYVFYNFDGKKINEEKFRLGEPTISSFKFISEYKLINNNGLTNKADTTTTASLISFLNDLRTPYAHLFSYKLPTFQFDNSDVLGAFDQPFYYYGIDTEFFYAKTFDYSVYKITTEKAEQVYKFLFPAGNAMPSDFTSNPIYNGKRIEYFKNNPEAIYGLANIYQLNDNLLFQVLNNSISSKSNNLIYNLKSGKLFAIERLLADEKSNYISFANSRDFLTQGLFACDGTYVFSSMSAYDFLEAYNSNADKKIIYSKEISTYLNKAEKKDNPVLVQIRIKNEL